MLSTLAETTSLWDTCTSADTASTLCYGYQPTTIRSSSGMGLGGPRHTTPSSLTDTLSSSSLSQVYIPSSMSPLQSPPEPRLLPFTSPCSEPTHSPSLPPVVRSSSVPTPQHNASSLSQQLALPGDFAFMQVSSSQLHPCALTVRVVSSRDSSGGEVPVVGDERALLCAAATTSPLSPLSTSAHSSPLLETPDPLPPLDITVDANRTTACQGVDDGVHVQRVPWADGDGGYSKTSAVQVP